MLYAIESGNRSKEIRDVPHQSFFDACSKRLTASELAAMKSLLNAMIDSYEVHTSSWMPGSDWNGTPFQPIYDKACGQDLDASGRFFGLLVWIVFQERTDAWSFGRYEKDNIPIKGMTYFRIKLS